MGPPGLGCETVDAALLTARPACGGLAPEQLVVDVSGALDLGDLDPFDRLAGLIDGTRAEHNDQVGHLAVGEEPQPSLSSS